MTRHNPTTQHATRNTQHVHRKSYLFLALLTLVVLTQVVILHWGPEAVFFVTWLFLALTVQHDGRLSVAVGLAFLATCPFLLIAEKDAVAEQAADCAYSFLAIGVLVQVEELVLERYGWLERKADFSYLWRPAAQALTRRWSAVVRALGRQLAAADRSELVRLVQIVGTAGLAMVFLWTAFSRAPLSVVLPLLGGALLFPFFVWVLWLVVRALGPVWLLRVALGLVVLPLAALEMVWLDDLLSADRLARMEAAYDFIERRDGAQRTYPIPEGEVIKAEVWTIDDVARWVLYHHPAFSGASRLAYNVWIGQGYVLAFDVAMAPASWDQPGDGVTFAVYVASDHGTRQVFSTYIDPKQNEADRRWHPHTVDLSAYAGQTVEIIFETGTGPADDTRYDWAGWGAPSLLKP
jgi:hypothetical protein